jgi:hypothetical protein
MSQSTYARKVLGENQSFTFHLPFGAVNRVGQVCHAKIQLPYKWSCDRHKFIMYTLAYKHHVDEELVLLA